MRKIRAVFPASGNHCGQLAQAYFSRVHFPTVGLRNCSKGISFKGNIAPEPAHSP